MSDEYEWLRKVDYKTWRRIMEELINRQKRELLFYIQMLSHPDVIKTGDESFDEYAKKVATEHYKRKIGQTLEALLENLDILYTVSEAKEEYEFYIDHQGSPYAVFVGRTLKQKYEEPLMYI